MRSLKKWISRLITYLVTFHFLISPIYPITPFIALAAETTKDYDFEVKTFDLPEYGSAGENIQVPIIINNSGTQIWYKESSELGKHIQLSYEIKKDTQVIDGSKTDLLADVGDINLVPNNVTDPLQKVTIDLPSDAGIYDIELGLYSVDDNQLIKASTPAIYQITVRTGDTLPPSGSINLNTGASYSLENQLKIVIKGEDKAGDGEEPDGNVYFRYGTSSDLSSIEYQPLTLDLDGNYVIDTTFENGFGTYNYFLQLKDGKNNESEVFSDSIDYLAYFIDGSVVIDDGKTFVTENGNEVLDEKVEIAVKGTGSNNLTEVAVNLDNQFDSSDWIPLETPGKNILFSFDDELAKQTGNQTVYIKLKDEFGNESDVYSDTVYLNYKNITSSLNTNLDKLLFAGTSDLSFSLTNIGDDIGYNAGITIELPKGFSFVESYEYIDGSKVTGSGVSPTLITTNSDGKQVLEYKSISDLLPGETVDVYLTIQVGGKAQGYRLGDVVNFDITGKLYREDNFAVPFEISETKTAELIPFELTLNAQDYDTGEVLVSQNLTNKITIRTNPEIESDNYIEGSDESPFTVAYNLASGIKYVDGTYKLQNYQGESESNVLFNVSDIEGVNALLNWAFHEKVGTGYYTNPLVILFDTVVPKFNEDTQDYISHNDVLTNQADAVGRYTNPPIATETPESKEYTDTDTDKLIAKYFRVTKSGVDHNTDTGKKIVYTVRIETSKDYDLTGIEMTDTLPDGVDYLGNIQKSGDLALVLFSNTKDLTSGKEILKWRITSAEGVKAGTAFEFSYEVNVNSDYEVKKLNDGDTRLLSSDYLSSNITLRGLWSDIDESAVRSAIDTDSDWTHSHLPYVTYSSGIKRVEDTDYTKSVDAKIGDILNVSANIEFPANVPTNNFVYKFYLPIGTSLNGDIRFNYQGSFQNSPATPDTTQGGYVVNLGKVEPGSTFTINYDLNVLDDPNLKLAVQTRNMFRGSYSNIDGNTTEIKDELILNIIEPNVILTKTVVSGYIARNEVANVKVVVTNMGTDSAYGVSFTDSIPLNTTLLENTDYIQDNIVNYSFDTNTNTFTTEEFNLEPGESVVLNYQVLGNTSLMYGDDASSTSTISEYKNRADEDVLPSRTYVPKTFQHNWKSKEPLLITKLERVGFESSEFIPVGKDDIATIRAQVKVVGGSPVYDTDINIDFNSLLELDSSFSPVCYVSSGTDFSQVTPSSENLGIYDFADVDLLSSNSVFECTFVIESGLDVNWDDEYPVSIEARGNDALGNSIRLDGSVEDIYDTDNDDRTDKNLVITKLDSTKPDGQIVFEQNGSVVTYTKESTAIAKYTAGDPINPHNINSYVVGVRFSDDGTNWTTISELPEINDSDKESIGIAGNWNSWDGSEISRSVDLPNEGENSLYMEIVDLYANTQVVKGTIVKDTLAPTYTFLNISPFEDDVTNPPYTGLFSNYLNFYSEDNSSQGLPSGLGSYAYSFDGTNWSEWLPMSDGINSKLLEFLPVSDGEKLNIYLKVRDLAGNEVQATLFDDITYFEHKIQITTELNSGDEYTASPMVDVGIEYIIEPANDLYQIRFGKNAEATDSASWEEYNPENLSHILSESWIDEEKTLCVQLRDNAANESNIACDTISLDTTAPTGLLLVPIKTAALSINLAIDAQDPVMADENPGSGNIQMRFSKIGEDCGLIVDETEKANCESEWSDWEAFTSNKNWTLDTYIGTQNVYVQFKDGVGNLSPVQTYSIIHNSTSNGTMAGGLEAVPATGSILINNDEVFTNTRHVMLDLNLNFDGTNCEGCTKPLLMRFIQVEGDNVPPVPPMVNSPDDNSLGWTYWQEYYDPKEWNLDPNQTNKPNYGLKKVYVQFMLPDARVTDLYYDSIIYAPYYSINYSNSSHDTLGAKEYTLDNVQTSYLAQDDFILKFNATNTGSFTWPKAGDNPVHLTYKWIWTGGEMPQGWTEDTIQKEIRGNVVVLPENINWNQETGEVSLKVDTPIIPGNYKLVIDGIHEGKAWFGDFGNTTPTYNIQIAENPDKPTPIPDFGNVLGENTGIGADVAVPYHWEADGWGHNCADTWGHNASTTCYIQGQWNVNRDTGYKEVCAAYGGHYKYEIVADGHLFNFCPSDTAYWNQFLGQQMTAKVTFWSNGYNFNINGIEPPRVYWKSELYQADNDPKLFQTIQVNKSTADKPVEFVIQPKFRNTGTGLWKRGETFLVSVDRNGNEVASPFKGNDWASNSRIYVDPNTSGWGQWTKAPFTGTIHIPENINWGVQEQCFQVRKDGTGFERSDVMCIKLDIQMTYQDKRNYYCPQPHPVYKEMDVNSEVIGNLNQNDGFVIKGDFGEWSLIYFPTGENEQGWVINNLECFGESEKIDNIIPAPTFEITEPPTGDTGIVQTIGGIDVKSGPSESFTTIGTLKEGDKVQVLAEAFMPGDKYGGWLLVRLEDGTEGWVPLGSIQYTNDPKDIQVNLVPELVHAHVCGGDRIPVYPMPGVKTTTVGYLENNQNIPIIKKWNGWYQIYLNKNGQTGWIEALTGLCDGYAYPKVNYCGSGEVGFPYERDVIQTSGYRTSSRPTHNGIDLGGAYGEPVLAATSGKVTSKSNVGSPGGDAKYISVFNEELNIKVGYWHLSGLADTVFDGVVEKGEVIGYTGNTGNVLCYENGQWVSPQKSSYPSRCGTHLHFQIYNYSIGDFVNPWDYLNSDGSTKSCVNPGGNEEETQNAEENAEEKIDCGLFYEDPSRIPNEEELKYCFGGVKEEVQSKEYSAQEIKGILGGNWNYVPDPVFNCLLGSTGDDGVNRDGWNMFNYALEIISSMNIIEFIPVIGDLSDIVTSIGGQDLNGKPLNCVERVINMAFGLVGTVADLIAPIVGCLAGGVAGIETGPGALVTCVLGAVGGEAVSGIGTEMFQKAMKEVSQKGIKEVLSEAIEKGVKEFVEELSDKGVKEFIVSGIKKFVTRNGDEATASFIQEVIIKDGKVVVKEIIQRCFVKSKASILELIGKTGSYKELEKLTYGWRKTLGIEVHHMVEKRLAERLGIENSDEIASIVLTKEQHRIITNELRERIPYSIDYGKLTKEEMLKSYREAYKKAGREDLLKYIEPYFQ